MQKEKIYVTKSSLPDYNKFCEMIKNIWDSKMLTNNGYYHQILEQKIKEFLQVNNITLYTNGHLALENALNLIKGQIPAGGGLEIITTPFTFVSTIHAIVRNGFKPVFCDINPDDYTIDVSKIENLINENTCAIVPVHVYGNICNVEKIKEISKKYNLKVIYDAAHAFGERINGESVANFGDISMFSFHATKVFNTIEGGCLAYNNNAYKQPLEQLKNFGIKNEDVTNFIGGNAKMNEFQSVFGICNLDELSNNIEKRKLLYHKYLELLKDIKGIKLNKLNEKISYNYSYFPIVISEEYGLSRESLIELLNKNNIFPRKYFYPLITELDCYKNNYDSTLTPIALDISKRVLTLPIYPDLEPEKVEEICNIIKKRELK